MAEKRSGDEARTSESTVAVMEMEIPSWTVGAGAGIMLSRWEERRGLQTLFEDCCSLQQSS
jgi:hypothetical protein